jgi:hypothetical protein
MRSFGATLLLLGILGYAYAAGRESELPPIAEGLSIGESFEQPAGRWQAARYGAAAVAGFGLLMLLFPKGR